MRRNLRKKEYCRTSYDTCNENYKKREMWRKKSENRERAKKTLGDLSSLRTKCEENARGSLLLVTVEYQLLSAVDITVRRARVRRNEKQSMKREKHRERYLRRGAHSIGSHEFFQSDEKLHQNIHRPVVRSADVKNPGKSSLSFLFFFVYMK